METTKKKRLGGMPPRYGFMLNPYTDQRVWRCPLCERNESDDAKQGDAV